MTDEIPQEKEYRLHSIRNLYAFDLFCQRRFEDSLNIFTQLGTGLFTVYFLIFWIKVVCVIQCVGYLWITHVLFGKLFLFDPLKALSC